VARRRAREVAFQALFQAERGGTPVREAWDELRLDLATSDEAEDARRGAAARAAGDVLEAGDLAFAERLVDALAEHKDRIDDDLRALIQGWTFGQMAQTDLNVLRLALAEFALAETPPAVAVEMAVRLAKRFGGEDSGRFVNGVLAKVLRQMPVAERV
jgi:transcription antitermination protein NusB